MTTALDTTIKFKVLDEQLVDPEAGKRFGALPASCVRCEGDPSSPPDWAVRFVLSPEFTRARKFYAESVGDSARLQDLGKDEIVTWAKNIAGRYTPHTVVFQFWMDVEFMAYRKKFGALGGSRFVPDSKTGELVFTMKDGADGQVFMPSPCDMCDYAAKGTEIQEPSSGEGAAGDTTAPPEWALEFVRKDMEAMRKLHIRYGATTVEKSPPLTDAAIMEQAKMLAQRYPNSSGCRTSVWYSADLSSYQALYGPLPHWKEGDPDYGVGFVLMQGS